MGAIATHSSDALLDRVLETIRESVVVTDRVGKIVCASWSAKALLGQPTRLQGRPLVGFVGADDRHAFRTLLQSATRPAGELTLVTRQGAEVTVIAEATEAGEWLVWSFDEAESERAGLQPPLERLVENLTDAAVVVDRRLCITLSNRAARQLDGFDAGRQLPSRWGGFDLESFATALFDPAALHAEAVLRLGEGRVLTLTGLPTRGRIRALLLLTDASSRERREQREREFIANAAHELQTPLTAIVGAIDVLEAGGIDDPDARDRFLGHLRRESERLVRLVQSLLLLARADSPSGLRTRTFPVRPLLDQVAKEVRLQPGVRLQVLAPPDLRIVTDRELLERALVNLAENAAKHTTSGRVLLTARAGRRGVTVEIQDTGSGMSAEERERAADRFYRGGARTGTGFGLGLAIVRQVAEALGGSFELESTPTEGTVARLVLPRP
jgi:two-component system sensor histidine kinase VicK